jgi:hypothetical protein
LFAKIRFALQKPSAESSTSLKVIPAFTATKKQNTYKAKSTAFI